MCASCGCAGTDVRVSGLGPGHQHDHDHGPGHRHAEVGHRHPGTGPQTLDLAVDVLAANDRLAERNRRALAERGIVTVNLMSSPGSGKTTLLERTVRDLGPELPIGVLEGDQETRLDAERIGATGVPAVQINTGAGCHLDAGMVDAGLRSLAPPPGALVFVENVGNLVCPALFDLGERARVVIMSVTEGADKPLKYPHIFRTADLMLVNKIDLLPYVDFDVVCCVDYARRARPGVPVLEISATRGDGLADWYSWLRTLHHTLERRQEPHL